MIVCSFRVDLWPIHLPNCIHWPEVSWLETTCHDGAQILSKVSVSLSQGAQFETCVTVAASIVYPRERMFSGSYRFPSSSWSCQCPCGCGTVVERYIIRHSLWAHTHPYMLVWRPSFRQLYTRALRLPRHMLWITQRVIYTWCRKHYLKDQSISERFCLVLETNNVVYSVALDQTAPKTTSRHHCCCFQN